MWPVSFQGESGTRISFVPAHQSQDSKTASQLSSPPAYPRISPTQRRNLAACLRSPHASDQKSFNCTVSAFLPEYVSNLQRRYGLCHGLSR